MVIVKCGKSFASYRSDANAENGIELMSWDAIACFPPLMFFSTRRGHSLLVLTVKR